MFLFVYDLQTSPLSAASKHVHPDQQRKNAVLIVQSKERKNDVFLLLTRLKRFYLVRVH